MISTQQVRMVLDRNRNGLDGLPLFAVGSQAATGVYWDAATRSLVPLESARTVDRDLILLSRHLDITLDNLVRQMAMGGGGHSGHAVTYRAGAQVGGHH